MWHHDKARIVVQAYVDASTDGDGVILDELTLDRPYGWVFFYESRAFVETGNEGERYVGNAPMIFDRVLGEYRLTGTAHPIEHYLAEYEKTLPQHVMQMPVQLRKR